MRWIVKVKIILYSIRYTYPLLTPAKDRLLGGGGGVGGIIFACEARCKILNIWKRKSFDVHVGPERPKGGAEIWAWLYSFSWRSRGYITVLQFF
jgi:hypothetical protein